MKVRGAQRIMSGVGDNQRSRTARGGILSTHFILSLKGASGHQLGEAKEEYAQGGRTRS